MLSGYNSNFKLKSLTHFGSFYSLIKEWTFSKEARKRHLRERTESRIPLVIKRQ